MLKWLVVASVVVVVLMLLRQRTAPPDPLKELVLMCRGDRERAQRLVAAERAKHPQLSERAAARRAVRSWRRDLR